MNELSFITKKLPLLVVSPFWFVTLLLFIWSISQMFSVGEQEGWVSVTGEVTSAEVKKSVLTEKNDSGRTINVVNFDPVIEYRYEVVKLEKVFSSTQYRTGMKQVYSRPADAEAFLREFPVGKKLTVYYDPDSPEDSVLEKATVESEIVLLIVATALFSGFSLFLIVLLKSQ